LAKQDRTPFVTLLQLIYLMGEQTFARFKNYLAILHWQPLRFTPTFRWIGSSKDI